MTKFSLLVRCACALAVLGLAAAAWAQPAPPLEEGAGASGAQPIPIPVPKDGKIIKFPPKPFWEQVWIWFQNLDLPWWLWWTLILVGVAALAYALYRWWTSGDEDEDELELFVMVDAIQFNHDPNDASKDALNIRQDLATTIEPPEWQFGETVKAEDCKAAYKIEGLAAAPTIKVRFAVYPTDVTSAVVRASGGGLLGAIDEQVIQFAGGVSDPEFVEIPLNHQTIGAAGVRRDDVAWDWQFRASPADGWLDMATTYHRIYVVLSEPQGPWQQLNYPANDQNPWADVLDFACEWAKAATTEDEAATKVTTEVNRPAGAVQYDRQGGASHFGPLSEFFCSLYVGQLKGQEWSKWVNCSDCAGMVTTFSNILGCKLWQANMARNFQIYKIIGIGYTDWDTPFENGGDRFSYHAVAWKAPAGNSEQLFDACLKVNGREDGSTGTPDFNNPLAELPVNVVFYDSTFCYKSKLVQQWNWYACNPTAGSSVRRKVV